MWSRQPGRLNLVDASLDVVFGAGSVHEGRLFLVEDDDAAGAAKVFGRQPSPACVPTVLADDLTPPVRMAMSSSIAFRRSPKPGALTGHAVESAAQLVDDEGGQGLALDVLSHDHDILADLENLLEGRQDIGNGGDLLVGNQDVWRRQWTASMRSWSVMK